MKTNLLSIELASTHDRENIYSLRHEIYARELGQHRENDEKRLTDGLDAHNIYIVAKSQRAIVGFISITPPSSPSYSIDKYFERTATSLVFDKTLYEFRLLTVVNEYRNSRAAALLMYAAMRFAEQSGAGTIVAIGRLEKMSMYLAIGFESLKMQTKSGSVTYELMKVDLAEVVARYATYRHKMEPYLKEGIVEPISKKNTECYHGGSFFKAIGEDFENLQRAATVISADVLDAWFDPAPAVIEKLTKYLPWALKTSPPTHSEGLKTVISQSRGIPVESILAGGGSSDLIFLAFTHWINRRSHVLILDPMYGEYSHILEKTIGCQVARFALDKNADYRIDTDKFKEALAHGYDFVVIVNPNSPTGQALSRDELIEILDLAPAKTRFWIDETYTDYLLEYNSLEHLAAASESIIVCKSLSKVFALSGVRCAYLCGPKDLIAKLRAITPPWAVSMPAQIAACEAFNNIPYYREKWRETHILRRELAAGLQNLGWNVVPGNANFLLCHIPENQPTAAEIIAACQRRKLFIRDVANMGKCFDNRTVRIAVKARETNTVMLDILSEVIQSLPGA